MAIISKISINGIIYNIGLYSGNAKPFQTWGSYVQVSESYPINNNENAIFLTDNYNQMTLSLSFYIESGISKSGTHILCTMSQPFIPYPSKMTFLDYNGQNPISIWTTDCKTIYFDNDNGAYNNSYRNWYTIKFQVFRKRYL